MSPVYLRDLGFERNQPEDREGLSRTRRPGRGHLRQSGGWENNEGDNINPLIHTPIQQEPQTRGLERYGSHSSAPPNPQRFISMEKGQKEVQLGIPLGRTWRKVPEDLSQTDRIQRPYGNHQRLECHQEVKTPGGAGKQDKGESSQFPSGQESPLFTIPGSFQEKTRILGQEQDHLQPEEQRVRPNDPEAVRIGEGSAQEPEIVANNSRINSAINRNITPTQIEHNVVTPESNLNSDELWLKMSQYAEKTQKQFAELEARHERMKILTAFMDKVVKNLQEGHAQLSKACEETNRRLNLVFEEQHHIKRDRDCLDQEINKLFNVYHSMKPQPQGHVMNNAYHQDDTKPDSMLMNKEISPSQYQDGDNMSYSEKEAFKQLPEASSWPKFSGTREYEHMELIDYIDGFFIDVPSITDCWITARLNTAFKGHSSIWYTEMKEIHERRNWPWWRVKSSKSTAMVL
ncbi:hypothetical protein O181_060446 [Austropuccinia psidii MF-1]|uniref:Uncharacterized protein n=1 Tax=Austropuccinia psidii MF-1 TaxID=1389203 RepID=A0A9Q3EKY8_9BASI|nr:hypothetical protein [Austropuccinia psidii MF-1]